jgi:mannose-6-phosphate isomerase-like protein (cupin superfamily)
VNQIRPASYTKHYDAPPQQSGAGSRTWITRGANFVVTLSEVTPGAVLARPHNPDEYMVLTVDTGATITDNGGKIEAVAESLTIVPPGVSAVTAKGDGRIVRIFSSKADDLARQAGNAANYADGAAEVAPIVPWPDPPGGFMLRNYVLADYQRADTNQRIFRCTNLMVNVLLKRDAPRDTRKLSPHSHDDFEQASLVLEGDYLHHMRYPWTKDMSEWRADEHLEIGSPSVTIIPAKVLHTSHNIGPRPSWLIDIFAPPRLDFSKKPGLVLNGDEYPMPAAN